MAESSKVQSVDVFPTADEQAARALADWGKKPEGQISPSLGEKPISQAPGVRDTVCLATAPGDILNNLTCNEVIYLPTFTDGTQLNDVLSSYGYGRVIPSLPGSDGWIAYALPDVRRWLDSARATPAWDAIITSSDDRNASGLADFPEVSGDHVVFSSPLNDAMSETRLEEDLILIRSKLQGVWERLGLPMALSMTVRLTYANKGFHDYSLVAIKFESKNSEVILPISFTEVAKAIILHAGLFLRAVPDPESDPQTNLEVVSFSVDLTS